MSGYTELIIFIVIIVIIIFLLKLLTRKLLTHPDLVSYALECIKWAEENIMGTKVGSERLAYVCGKVILILPKYLQIIISTKDLEKFISTTFQIIKEELITHQK